MQAEQRQQQILVILGAVGLLALGVLGYLLYNSGDTAPTIQQTLPAPVPKPVEPAPVVAAKTVVELQPPTPVVRAPAPVESSMILPALTDSDQLIRDAVGNLASNAGVRNWVLADELIRKFVVLVDNVSQGKVPKRNLEFLAPSGGLQVSPLGPATFALDEGNFQRFDLFVDILTSFDSRRTVEFYVLIRPLFQEAYEELGYADGRFDLVLSEAIEEVINAPVIESPIELARPVVVYTFVDPQLESLGQVEKQLIRMGPANTRRVQEKLKELLLEMQTQLPR